MRDVLKYEFGNVSIFDNYIIVEMKEGIVVKPEYNDDLIKVQATYFAGQPFGYVSHRKNSYSVNTNIYLETSKIDNLVGFAIVSENKLRIENSKIEQQFLKQPLKTFDSLDKATSWIESLIN